MSPSPFYPHNRLSAKLLRLMDEYLEQNRLGEAVVETDVMLPDGGDPLRPDISVLLNESLNKVYGHIHGAPDIVVEILSEHTRQRDLSVKSERYLATGVKEYWIADPEAKFIEIRINRQGREWESRIGQYLKSEILSNLRIDIDWLFRDLRTADS